MGCRSVCALLCFLHSLILRRRCVTAWSAVCLMALTGEAWYYRYPGLPTHCQAYLAGRNSLLGSRF